MFHSPFVDLSFELSSGLVGLGNKYFIFCCLTVRWGKRVESSFRARIVIGFIVRSIICALGLACGFISLGTTNNSFSARLSVSWRRRVDFYFRGEYCCDTVRLCICPLAVASGFVGLGITNISFSHCLSVNWGRREESHYRGENCDFITLSAGRSDRLGWRVDSWGWG